MCTIACGMDSAYRTYNLDLYAELLEMILEANSEQMSLFMSMDAQEVNKVFECMCDDENHACIFSHGMYNKHCETEKWS
jgi:L-rhamnose mutarotase